MATKEDVKLRGCRIVFAFAVRACAAGEDLSALEMEYGPLPLDEGF